MSEGQPAKRRKTEATPSAVPTQSEDVKGTAILDHADIQKKKELRAAAQRAVIEDQLRNQGIELGGVAEEVEGYYDRTSEVKKEGDVTIEPFRMDGHFDNEGAYVERANDDDPWYAEWEKSKDQTGYQAPKSHVGEEKEEKKEQSELELKETLLKYLQPGEMVIKAIRRLGKKKQQQRPQPQRHWMKKNAQKRAAAGKSMDAAVPATVGEDQKIVKTAAELQMEAHQKNRAKKAVKTPEEAQKARELDELSSAAGELLARGFYNTYQDTYDEIKGFVDRQKAQAAEAKEWEYRFGDTEKVFAGFTSSQMQKWNKAKYFSKAFVRKIGTPTWLKCEENFQF